MTIQINGTTGISGVDGSAAAPALQGSDTNTGIAFGSDVIIGSTGGTERFRCDSSGRLLVGTSTNLATNQSVKQEIANGNLFVSTFTNDAFANNVSILKSRSTGSLGTVVQNGDELGTINFLGDDGTSTAKTGVAIKAYVDGVPGNNDLPSRMSFWTTADGASSPTERMRIANNGAISTVVPGGSTLYPAYDCRAWVNFNGTGVVAIRASGNVSSITDNGTGDYTVNFTTAMPDANYSVVATNIGSVNVNQRSFAASSNNALATGSCRMVLVQDSGALNDQDTVSVAIFR